MLITAVCFFYDTTNKCHITCHIAFGFTAEDSYDFFVIHVFTAWMISQSIKRNT